MTEDEARAWLMNLHVSRETLEKLEAYVALLLTEAERQNLISNSTRDHVWARHIVDSAQLLRLAPTDCNGDWIDLGSGAGLPGIVIGAMSDFKVTLIESRTKRVEFLQTVVDQLDLTNVTVASRRVETFHSHAAAAVISARAYAPLPKLLDSATHLADKNTFWLLPKGKSWQTDLNAASACWEGVFHVEHSATDIESAIIVGQRLRRKKKARQ